MYLIPPGVCLIWPPHTSLIIHSFQTKLGKINVGAPLGVTCVFMLRSLSSMRHLKCRHSNVGILGSALGSLVVAISIGQDTNYPYFLQLFSLAHQPSDGRVGPSAGCGKPYLVPLILAQKIGWRWFSMLIVSNLEVTAVATHPFPPEHSISVCFTRPESPRATVRVVDPQGG